MDDYISIQARLSTGRDTLFMFKTPLQYSELYSRCKKWFEKLSPEGTVPDIHISYQNLVLGEETVSRLLLYSTVHLSINLSKDGN